MAQPGFTLRFSDSKSRCSGLKRYEHVGQRLANQQDFKNRIESLKTGLLFSPDVDERLTKKGLKHISKSEENLLTPEQTDDVNYRMSWTGPNNTNFQEISTSGTLLFVETFDKESNPSDRVLMVEIPPEFPCEPTDVNVNDKHEDSLTGSSLNGDENNLTTETLLKIQKAFSESGSHLNALTSDSPPSESDSRKEKLSAVPNVEFSPEKTLSEAKDYHDVTVLSLEKHDEDNCSKEDSIVSGQNLLVNQLQNLVKGSAVEFHTVQEGAKSDENLHLNMQEFHMNDQTNKEEPARGKEIIIAEETEISFEDNKLSCSNPEEVVTESPGQVTCHMSELWRNERIIQQQSLVPTCNKTLPGDFQVTDHGKVSDHIQWFNKLLLNDSRAEIKVKSPLKFQRTPVRQSVRRINSLMETNRQLGRFASLREVSSPLVKAMSYDHELSSHIESTSNNSSSALLYSEHKQKQKSVAFAQSSTELISKSSLESSSKLCSKVKRHSDSSNTSLIPTKVCKFTTYT